MTDDRFSAGNLDQRHLRETVIRVLRNLTDRERRVLRRRFGIGTGSDQSLEDVQRRFSVTCERIRLIEAKALRKLDKRSPPDDEES